MTGQNEKRSSPDGCVAPLALPLSAATGVGGRQAPPEVSPGGGGYLNICTTPDVEGVKKIADPRLNDLAAMGMPEIWLRIAAEIGVDPFLKMWRMLDDENRMLSESESQIEVKLRRYRSYKRYIRNRYIEELFREGHSARRIRELLQSQLCEKTCISNILRLRPKV